MKFEAKLRKVGNSHVITVPSYIAKVLLNKLQMEKKHKFKVLK